MPLFCPKDGVHLRQNDVRVSLLAAYFLSTRALADLPNAIGTQYAASLLQAHGHIASSVSVDEIGPVLRKKFKVPIPPGFDFRQELSLADPQLYERALQHLRLAVWYLDTNPTYFVNHIHN